MVGISLNLIKEKHNLRTEGWSSGTNMHCIMNMK